MPFADRIAAIRKSMKISQEKLGESAPLHFGNQGKGHHLIQGSRTWPIAWMYLWIICSDGPMKKIIKNSPLFKTASCLTILFHGSRHFRSRHFHVWLIFWMGLKLVEKLPHKLQPVLVHLPDPPDDFIPVHCFSFPLGRPGRFSRVALL